MRWVWRSARPRRSRAHRALVAAIVVLGSAGCYHYAPLDATSLPTGTAVRFSLSSTGVTHLGPILGAGTNAVEGTVLATTDTGYRMAVTGTRKSTMPGLLAWAGEQVTVPRDAIDRVELRTLDRKRTLGIAGLAILAGVAIKLLIDSFDATAGGDDGGGGPITP
jgi:hypothetical protein